MKVLMKKLALVTMIALVLTQFANAGYSIKTELELPNSKPTATEMLSNEKGTATVSVQDTSIIIESSEHTKGTVMMKAQIFKMENGTQKLIATPQVISKLGQPAEIAQHSQDGKLLFRLKLTPSKIR